MAFCIASTSSRPTSTLSVQKKIQCIDSPEFSASTVVRRSGNYQPSIWDEDYLLSLTSDYTVLTILFFLLFLLRYLFGLYK